MRALTLSSIVAAYALAGCAVQLDLVAHLDGGTVPPVADGGGGLAKDANFMDSYPPPIEDASVQRSFEALGCKSEALHIIAIDAAGALSRLHGDTLEVAPLGAPPCLADGVLAATMDTAGLLWVSTPDGSLWQVDPDRLTCTQVELGMRSVAVASVYDASRAREQLYLLDEADVLSRFDPVSLQLEAVMEISATGLAGSLDGTLVTLDTNTYETLLLETFAVASRSWLASVEVASPNAARLSAATAWQGQLVLMFGAELYRYDRSTNELFLLRELYDSETPMVIAS